MQAGSNQPRDWHLRRRAEVTGGEVAFDVFGEGPPAVLVHGTPTWSYLWRNIVPALSDRFTVYVFDLLGYGGSEPKGRDVSIAAQTRLLTELVGLWELEVPAVAAAHIGTAVHRPMDEATFEQYFAQWPGKDGQEAYLQKVAQFDEEYTTEFEPLLDSMQTPVRIIWGKRDAWPDLAFAGRLHELLPNSDLKLIPEAGHFVMEDAPEEATRGLRDFFAMGDCR